jgi:hypothetical protein
MFITQNALFVHVPRTGGNFIKKTLRSSGNLDVHDKFKSHILKPHFSLELIPDAVRGDRVIWTCVRNPVDHLHSFWACRWKIFLSRPHKELATLYEQLFDESFTTFVEKYLENSPGNMSARYREMLTLGGSYPAVDHILKTENIESDLREVGKKLNFKLPNNFSKYNSSPRENRTLPESLKKQLMDAEADMMNTFNYS